MVLDVRFRPADVGDLFLGAGRDVLVVLEFRDGGLTGARNVVVRGVLVGKRHGNSFDRCLPQRMPASGRRKPGVGGIASKNPITPTR
jgi:hypothetical protein